MGRKIFISYKYNDNNVKMLNTKYDTTVRNYVDELETYLKKDSEHIYKGEQDGEDLSHLSEETIGRKLRDRIHDSSLTIVLISPNMKEYLKEEKKQWIPREISYSLQERSRMNSNGDRRVSKTNAVIAIALPDKNGSYEYYIQGNKCCKSGCRTLKTNTLFNILSNNMFNNKNSIKRECETGSTLYSGESSYIKSVKWIDFIDSIEDYIQVAYEIRDNISEYEITKLN